MQDVAYLIEIMIEDYYRDAGRKPAGIIVGPTEYRTLCNQMSHKVGFLKETAVENALLTEYKGFPLFVKELPGIDLLIPYQEAFSVAYR